MEASRYYSVRPYDNTDVRHTLFIPILSKQDLIHIKAFALLYFCVKSTEFPISWGELLYY